MGYGDSTIARLKLEEIDGRTPPGVESIEGDSPVVTSNGQKTCCNVPTEFMCAENGRYKARPDAVLIGRWAGAYTSADLGGSSYNSSGKEDPVELDSSVTPGSCAAVASCASDPYLSDGEFDWGGTSARLQRRWPKAIPLLTEHLAMATLLFDSSIPSRDRLVLHYCYGTKGADARPLVVPISGKVRAKQRPGTEELKASKLQRGPTVLSSMKTTCLGAAAVIHKIASG
ncbi:hypothetical protein CWI39_0041p0010 [Hamiltosporidium magnivora]|nr:hypothetical protein CWI39_0041p0010 [Hamiltosporidium magnivora]